MTRIVAGTYRGRRLSVPATNTRPTSDRVREAIFSRLESWGDVDDAHVLDLYAGSGALGLEALSRGAADAILVDRARAAVIACRDNIRTLGCEDQARVVARDAASYLTTATDTFTLAFVDPPYAIDTLQIETVLAALAQRMEPRGLIVFETSTRVATPTWPRTCRVESQRSWRDTRVWFLTVDGDDNPGQGENPGEGAAGNSHGNDQEEDRR